MRSSAVSVSTRSCAQSPMVAIEVYAGSAVLMARTRTAAAYATFEPKEGRARQNASTMASQTVARGEENRLST